MGSSKRKSSFRIDDILQQQTENHILSQHITSLKPPSQINETRLSSPSSSPTASSISSHLPHSPQMEPRKPMPMYHPQMMDLQKTNFFPFNFGMPQFPPAAYLEHYASVLHKASPRGIWPGLYPHPYAGYLLPPCGSKRKGGQVRFTPQQTQSLERRFVQHKYLSPEDRRLLAVQLKLSDRQVKTWFQNRRAKWRRSNNGTAPLDSASELNETDGSSTPPLDLQIRSNGVHMETSSDDDDDNYDDPDSPINVA